MNNNITIRKSLSLEAVFKDAAKKPLLTNDQEVELASLVKQGDEQALKELYSCNLRFVVSVAKQYLDRGKTLEELIEVGNKGLELAARTFNPQQGFKFISYAVWFIRASILALLEASKNSINLSELTIEEKREMVSRMTNERDKEILTKWLGLIESPESLEEIGQNLNLTTKRVKQLRDRAIARLAAQKDK